MRSLQHHNVNASLYLLVTPSHPYIRKFTKWGKNERKCYLLYFISQREYMFLKEYIVLIIPSTLSHFVCHSLRRVVYCSLLLLGQVWAATNLHQHFHHSWRMDRQCSLSEFPVLTLGGELKETLQCFYISKYSIGQKIFPVMRKN